MKAKLLEPITGLKNWSLEFTEANNKLEDIQKISLDIGKQYNVHPFIQGKQMGWIMIEFWTGDESSILEASIEICKTLDVSLDL